MEKLKSSDRSPDFLNTKLFNTIASVAKKRDCNAMVIGGMVRDYFLQRPLKDIDIVVTGNGVAFAQEVADALEVKNVTAYNRFGTAMFVYDGWDVEFVGARKESYRSDSRKPIVENGTIQDDLKRRDFTINTLAFSLNSENYGEFVDSFNGLADLRNNIIKTPLDPLITFSDDPLRMMRAIRFASQLDMVISDESLHAITVQNERITMISKERITDELNNIILSKTPSKGFILLDKTGLLPHIFPEMAALKGVEFINNKGHKDNFFHTLEVLDNICKNTDDLWLRWAALLHDIAKPQTKRYKEGHGWTFHGHEDKGARMIPRIFKNLRLPLNNKMRFVQKLVRLHLRPIALTNDEITDSGIRRLLFDAGDDLEGLMILCEADITTKNSSKLIRYLSRFKEVREKLKITEENDRLRNWQPPIDGEIIMKTFGLSPCKEIGILKNTIREAILDGKIKNDYLEAFNFLLEEANKLGLTPVNTKKS